MTDRNSIYQSYKQRLISMNARNSSFFLGKLQPKRHIDLALIANAYNNTEDIYDKLLNSKTIKLKRLIVNKELLISIFLEMADDYRNIALRHLPQLKLSDFDEYEALVNTKADLSTLSIHTSKLIKKYEDENQQIFKDFITLDKATRQTLRETGKSDLSLGFPFVEGKIGNKDFRAPLVIHPVTLTITGSSIAIKILEEGKMINPIFVLSYFNENKKEHQRFDFEISDAPNFNYRKYSEQFLKNEGINVSYNEHDLMVIESISKKDYTAKTFNQLNTFKINNYCVAGMFPISSQNIYNDIDYLDQNPNKTSKSLDNFLKGIKTYSNNDAITPSESEIKYISPLDWSQRLVVKSAMMQDLVIEGPPGTGKSQTIVNLIVNLLLQDKTVLVVSEKVAAIEVVYNRLGLLREHTLLIKDYIKDKNDFFDQIIKTSQNLEQTYVASYDTKYDYNISRYIESLKQINNSNFYNEFSYEDVLAFASKLELLNHFKDNKIVSDFIVSVKNSFKNIKYELARIINDVNVAAIKSYNQDMESDLFDKIAEDDAIFLYEQISNNYLKKQIMYNYYLYKTNETVEHYKILTPHKIGITPKSYNYMEFNKYANALYNKFIKHKASIIEFTKKLYTDLGFNKALIALALKWDSIPDSDRPLAIANTRPIKPKQCFIKLFRKKIKLTDSEQIFNDYLNNYASSFNKVVLADINDNLSEEELILYKMLLVTDVLTLSDIYDFLLSSNIINFSDANFDNMYEIFTKALKGLDFKTIIAVKALNESDLSLLNLFNNSKLTIDTFTNAIIANYIGFDKLNEANTISKYLSNNEASYRDALLNMQHKYDESASYVYNYVKSDINNKFKANSELYGVYSNLVNQASQKRKRSVRTIFNRYSDAIRTIYPVILTTPDTVSSLFAMEPELFDYVIFDEASQMFTERAVPAIQRSKQVIVAGDSKQLKPSSTFTSRFTESDDLDDDESLSDQELEALDKESLLDMSKGKYASKMLQVHYRSEHSELIEFSSHAFYDNKLFFASNINTNSYHKPIEVINATSGMWSSNNTNEIEAMEVVRIIKEILTNRTNNETIGVITFNIKQRDLIYSMLEAEDNANINRELDRFNITTLEDESLFIKNIENVQGDERDIIIFSIGYARDIDNKLSARFGTLNQSGGENRLNVAITRAKKKIYVVKSIKAVDLKVNMDNPGPRRLKEYLQYVELVASNNKEGREVLLDSLYKEKNREVIEFSNSIFKQEVHVALANTLSNSYVVRKNLNIGGYIIDFGIYERESNKFILGIKTDSYEWVANPKDREIDFHQEQYLQARGWSIYKMLSTNWNKDREEEMNKLRLVLEQKSI